MVISSDLNVPNTHFFANVSLCFKFFIYIPFVNDSLGATLVEYWTVIYLIKALVLIKFYTERTSCLFQTRVYKFFEAALLQ